MTAVHALRRKPPLYAESRAFVLHFLLECRLLVRLRWPLLLPLGAGGWILLALFAPVGAQPAPNYYALAAVQHAIVQSLSTLVPALLGVLLMRRDLMSGQFDWSFNTPLPNMGLVAAKFAAGFAYMSLFVLCVAAGDAAAALRFGIDPASILRELCWLALHYGVSYAVTLALGMLLGAWMPVRFALPIAFLGWVFGAFFLQVFALAGTRWYMLKAFMLVHLLTNGPAFGNDAWTPTLYWEEYGKLSLFVAAFGIFMLAAAAAAVSRIRPAARDRRPLAGAALALLAAAIAAIPYGLMWSDRYEQMDAIRGASPSYRELKPHDSFVFRMDRMTIKAQRLHDDTLQAEATAAIPLRDGKPIPAAPGVKKVAQPEPGRLSFLLHPAMRIASVRWNGAAADWSRKGDRVSIAIPDNESADSVSIEFRYEGRIDDWARSNNSEGYWAFIRNGSVYLPASVGWYPLPGGDSLFFKGFSVREAPGDYVNRMDVALHSRSDFDVTLIGFETPLFATLPEAPAETGASSERHFAGRGAHGLDVIGGRFIQVAKQGEPSVVVTTEGSRRRASLLLKQMESLKSYYDSWLSDSVQLPRQIWMNGIFDVTPGTAQGSSTVWNDTIVLSENGRDSYTDDLQLAANIMLFGDLDRSADSWSPDASAEPSILFELRNAIRIVHDIERPSDAPIAVNAGSRQWLTIKAKIDEEAASGRLDQVKRVLSRLWTQSGGLKSPAGQPLAPALTMQDWNTAWNEEMKR